MKIGKKTRVVLDVVLTLMIVFEMFIQYTGNFLHEVVGFAFFATVVTHLAFSAAWMKSTASMAKKGKLSARNIALAVMGCLLAIDMIVLGVSSVAISQLLYSAGFTWTFGSYALWAAVHSASSYALCALVVVHLGMHWAFLASAFKVPYDPSRRKAISAGVYTVAALGAVALGVAATKGTLFQAAGAMLDETASASSDKGTASFSGPISDQVAPSDKGGKGRRGMSGNVPSSDAASSQGPANDAGPVSGSPTAAEPESPAPSAPVNEEPQAVETEDDTSSVSGICTLCRKQCPLSAPQCDKPYRAGLL